jgi:hypothetical protein
MREENILSTKHDDSDSIIITWDTEEESVDDFWDRWQREHNERIAAMPWYQRLKHKVWPIRYKYAPWRWVENWSWDKFRLPSKPKYFIQRAKHGWSTADTWNFDSYLASIIIGGLKQLDSRHHGVPCSAYDENNEELYVIGSYDYDIPEEEAKSVEEMRVASELWHQVLMDIVAGFETHEEFDDASLSDKKEIQPKIDKAFKLLHNNFGRFWD